jgi:hypothetical protein
VWRCRRDRCEKEEEGSAELGEDGIGWVDDTIKEMCFKKQG